MNDKKKDFLELIEKSELGHKEFLTDEEQAYRRGFAHGFEVAKNNPAITSGQIDEWRYSEEETGAPGTSLASQRLQGLRRQA